MARVFFSALISATCLAAANLAMAETAPPQNWGQNGGIATNLAVCLGKLNAGGGYASYVPGAANARYAAAAAFQRLLPAMRITDPSSYMQQMKEVEASYGQDLISEPLQIRAKLASLSSECNLNTAMAKEFRAALDRKDAQAEAARVAEQTARLAMAKAEQQARLDAEKAKAEADRARTEEEAKARDFDRAQALAKLEAMKADAQRSTVEAEARKAEADRATAEATARRAEAEKAIALGKAEPSKVSPKESAANATVAGVADAHPGDFKINGQVATVQNIALGADRKSCPSTVHRATWSSGYGEERFAYVCEFGKSSDKTVAFYDTTGTHVVSVYRRLGVDIRKVEIKGIIKTAEEHYGKPTFLDEKNYDMAYGDMFEPGANSGSIRNKDSGRGLRISGKLCGGRQDCSDLNDATGVIVFDLTDAAAYNRSIEDGKLAYQAEKKTQMTTAAKNVSF